MTTPLTSGSTDSFLSETIPPNPYLEGVYANYFEVTDQILNALARIINGEVAVSEADLGELFTGLNGWILHDDLKVLKTDEATVKKLHFQVLGTELEIKAAPPKPNLEARMKMKPLSAELAEKLFEDVDPKKDGSMDTEHDSDFFQEIGIPKEDDEEGSKVDLTYSDTPAILPRAINLNEDDEEETDEDTYPEDSDENSEELYQNAHQQVSDSTTPSPIENPEATAATNQPPTTQDVTLTEEEQIQIALKKSIHDKVTDNEALVRFREQQKQLEMEDQENKKNEEDLINKWKESERNKKEAQAKISQQPTKNNQEEPEERKKKESRRKEDERKTRPVTTLEDLRKRTSMSKSVHFGGFEHLTMIPTSQKQVNRGNTLLKPAIRGHGATVPSIQDRAQNQALKAVGPTKKQSLKSTAGAQQRPVTPYEGSGATPKITNPSASVIYPKAPEVVEKAEAVMIWSGIKTDIDTQASILGMIATMCSETRESQRRMEEKIEDLENVNRVLMSEVTSLREENRQLANSIQILINKPRGSAAPPQSAQIPEAPTSSLAARILATPSARTTPPTAPPPVLEEKSEMEKLREKLLAIDKTSGQAVGKTVKGKDGIDRYVPPTRADHLAKEKETKRMREEALRDLELTKDSFAQPLFTPTAVLDPVSIQSKMNVSFDPLSFKNKMLTCKFFENFFVQNRFGPAYLQMVKRLKIHKVGDSSYVTLVKQLAEHLS